MIGIFGNWDHLWWETHTVTLIAALLTLYLAFHLKEATCTVEDLVAMLAREALRMVVMPRETDRLVRDHLVALLTLCNCPHDA
jgi:hypothetical protein